jgi:hypothetical protein
VIALLPLLLIGLVPLLTGDIPAQHLWPIVPLAHDAAGNAVPGHWNAPHHALCQRVVRGGMVDVQLRDGGLLHREFRDPKTDTFKAILFGLALRGRVHTGPDQLPGCSRPLGNAGARHLQQHGRGQGHGGDDFAGPVIGNMIVVMMVLALLLAIITSMAGSSRTLYQASADGWLPRYLSRVNEKGAPTAAMWTDLGHICCCCRCRIMCSCWRSRTCATSVQLPQSQFGVDPSPRSPELERLSRAAAAARWERCFPSSIWRDGHGG